MAARRRTRGYKRAHARGGRLTSGANSIASGSDAGCQPPGSACDYGLGRRTPYQHGLSAGSSGPRLASLVIGLVLYSGRLARRSDTPTRVGDTGKQSSEGACSASEGSQTDRSPAWPGIESTDSSADRPPLTGPQHINIRWKRKDCDFRDRGAGVAEQIFDRWSRSIVGFSLSACYLKANSAGPRAAETARFCRAPNLITICEAIPPPSINKVAQNSPNPDRLS